MVTPCNMDVLWLMRSHWGPLLCPRHPWFPRNPGEGRRWTVGERDGDRRRGRGHTRQEGAGAGGLRSTSSHVTAGSSSLIPWTGFAVVVTGSTSRRTVSVRSAKVAPRYSVKTRNKEVASLSRMRSVWMSTNAGWGASPSLPGSAWCWVSLLLPSGTRDAVPVFSPAGLFGCCSGVLPSGARVSGPCCSRACCLRAPGFGSLLTKRITR